MIALALLPSTKPLSNALCIVVIDRLCHTRELAIVEMEEPELRQLMPEIYYSVCSISKVRYVKQERRELLQ